VPTVAAMASMTAAVFVVGGLPSGGWLDDAPLRPSLAEAAARLTHADVLMLNNSSDEFFPPADAHALFDAIRGRSKRLSFRDGDHDEWPDDLVTESTAFVRAHTTAQ